MKSEVQHVIKVLIEAGHSTFIVGGAVRDLLSGRTPKDWDVATAASPEVVMGLFPHTIPTGLQHGTVTVMVGGEAIEVTTFRGEGAYDGRRPSEVRFLSRIEEDLRRRDFTFNAIAMGVGGEVIDPFHGARDLQQGIVRAVGDARERFLEDQLRIFRGVRFVSKFGFVLDPDTFQAAREVVRTKGFGMVSRERVISELIRTLQEARDGESRGRAILLLHELGVMGAIDIPWEEWDRDLSWYRDWLHGQPVEVMLATLLRPLWGEIGKDSPQRGAKNLYERFRIPTSIGERIVQICQTRPENLSDLDPAHAGRVLLARYPEIQSWLWIEEAFGHPHGETRAQVGAALAGPPFPRSIRDLPVSGKDLIELGMSPGKAVGRRLERMFDRMLERPDTTRSELLEIRSD